MQYIPCKRNDSASEGISVLIDFNKLSLKDLDNSINNPIIKIVINLRTKKKKIMVSLIH